MKSVKKRTAIWLTLLLILTLAATAFGSLSAVAETVPIGQVYSGRSEGLSETELYDATNTYNYNGNNPNITVSSDGSFKITEGQEDAFRKYKYYDVSLNGNNDNKVADDAPLITVLTHGLGGKASHWSNNEDNFAPDSESLISKLATDSGANVYWAKMNGHKSFCLLDLQNSNNIISNNYIAPEDGYTVSQINDISKHIIIVFEALLNENDKFNASNSYNNVVYEEFNYMLSKIVYDVKALNNGKLPKINLIGHSRGGITNLQYALDHPQMVDSMFGIGTPYFGSNTASTKLGAKIANYSDGLYDIIDSEIYTEYYNRWKNTASCENIKVHALGGYSDTDFVFDSLLANEDYLKAEDIPPIILKCAKVAIKIPRIVASTDMFISFLGSIGVSEAEKYAEVLDDLIIKDNRLLFVRLLFALFKKPMYDSPMLMNDLLVDLHSQLGEDRHSDKSYGFIQYAREFKESDYENSEKKISTTDLPAVVHNLEARDTQFINYIRKNINMAGVEPGYIYSINGDVAALNGYRGLMCENGVLTLPSEIDGHTVTEISNGAFEDIAEYENFTKVIIPATVTRLGATAFAGNLMLATVEFESGSMLKKIGAECFAGCTALSSIIIPDGTEIISDNAFYRCESLKTLHLPASILLLGNSITYGCSLLESITVDSENADYMSIDGVVFSKNFDALCLYPAGKKDKTYTVPAGITTIWFYSFMGNKYLQSINLNEVMDIYWNAFENCENLFEITETNLRLVRENAFENTAWLNNKLADDSVEYVELGDVLIKYKGNDSVVTFEKYESIAPYAFALNKDITDVILKGNKLRRIGAGAFMGCENLARVQIENTDYVVDFYNDVFGECAENLNIYVPYRFLSQYIENETGEVYTYNFNAISTTVELDTNGGNLLKPATFYYGEFLDGLPMPQREHYNFVGWQYFDGTETVNVALPFYWNYTAENAVLTAVWNEIEYPLYLHYDSKNIETTSYKWSSGKTLPEATKAGYTFAGWYNNPEFEGLPVRHISAGESGLKDLYAGFAPNTYTVTLDCNYPDCPQMQPVEITFGELYTLPVLEREGYIFNGWQGENGELYTSDKGNSFQGWNIPENTTFKAIWTRKVFSVKVNGDGTIVWMTENNFSDEQTFIPFGTEFAAMEELIEAFKSYKSSFVVGYEFVGFYVNGEIFNIWDTMPDLGEDGSIFDIEAIYKAETYEIVFVDLDETITVEYGATLTLPTASKYGYDFEFWKIYNNDNNRYTFAQNGQFAVGKIFAYTTMPDLSESMGKSGIKIYLEGDYTPKSNDITFISGLQQELQPIKIFHDSLGPIIIPYKAGYEFCGWYEIQISSTGRVWEVDMTDSKGNLLKPWSYRTEEERINFYPRWQVIRYTITYETYGGTLIGTVKTTYIVEDSFVLPTAQKDGYVFQGWYSSRFNKKMDKLTMGTTGDLTFFAQYSKLYNVSFYDGNELLHTEAAISGQKVTVIEYDGLYGYHPVWTGNLKSGDIITVQNEDIVLKVLEWEENSFAIKLYSNLTDNDFSFSIAVVTFSKSAQLKVPSRKGYKFLGWYAYEGHDNSTLCHKQKQYTGENGAIIIWNENKAVDLIAEFIPTMYHMIDYTRTESYKITDSGRFNQPYDILNLYNCGYNLFELNEAGYHSIKIDIYMDVSEKYDGHQYVMLYNGVSTTAVQLTGTDFVNDSKKIKKHHIVFELPITGDLPDVLCVRYGATGSFEDDWYSHNISVSVEAYVAECVTNSFHEVVS